MKTAELTGAALDRAVGRALGLSPEPNVKHGMPDWRYSATGLGLDCPSEDQEYGDAFEPSQRWDHGGPIIERERINIWNDGNGIRAAVYTGPGRIVRFYSGPTPLVAAMRAYVASKFGDEVPTL